MTAVHEILFGNAGLFHASNSEIGGTPLDAAADAVGAIYKAPRAGTIDRIGVWTVSVVGTSPTYRLALETVADGPQPSNTVRTNTAVQPAQLLTTLSAGWTWHTLTNALDNVTAGMEIAATVRYSSGTVDGSNHALVANNVITNATRNHPFPVVNTTGAWATFARAPIIALRYSDDFIVRGVCPINFLGTSNFAQNSTPDERGIFFTPPFTMSCIGAAAAIFPTGTAADFDIVLYDSASTALRTVSFDVNRVSAATSWGQFRVGWSPVTLTQGANYRITLRPSTNNNVRLATYRYASQAELLTFQDAYLTERTDAGSWTTFNNATDGFRSGCICPILEDITTGGVSGGLLVHPGMVGGARG